MHEVELAPSHRVTGRDAAGFAHRGRQLADAVLALGPQGVNHRGLRLPLVGWLLGLAGGPAATAIAAVGIADDLWSRTRRRPCHLRAPHDRRLKLVVIPAVGLLATRRASGALLVGLAANLWNQLDTQPGRALKAYLIAALPLRASLLPAAVLLPCDCREMTMLGDAGSNVLGGLLGLRSVGRLTERGRWIAIGALASSTSSVNSFARRADRAQPRSFAISTRWGDSRDAQRREVRLHHRGVVSSLGKGITGASLGRCSRRAASRSRCRSSTRTSTSIPGR